MIPSEKAIELANKFLSKSIFDINNEELEIQRKQGKAFAIICVDEILKDNPNIHDDNRLNYKYWEQVKKEIQLL